MYVIFYLNVPLQLQVGHILWTNQEQEASTKLHGHRTELKSPELAEMAT